MITVLLLGNSQTAGRMGDLLEQHYQNHGVEVHREAASGKGVLYFLRATSLPDEETSFSPLIEEIVMHHSQRERIRDVLSSGHLDYIIFPSLGGNDAYHGCCTGSNRRRLIQRYRRLFNQLCSYGAIVVFNGSPPADVSRWPRFDRRRAELDKIQDEAAKGTCVIRNSTRSLRIPPDRDGYHYNRSADLYVDHLMRLPGMELPIIEATD